MFLGSLLLAALASTIPPTVGAYDAAGPPESSISRQIVASARYYLAHKPPGPDQCTNYVRQVYLRVGVEMGGSGGDLWERADAIGTAHRGRARVGDIAFFHNTFDRNGNGRVDDPFTHVGVVIGVANDGTVTVAHGGATHGTGTFRMNPEHPELRVGPEGQRWNDYLRVQKRNDPPQTRYLASDLLAGYATVRPEDRPHWKPGT